MQLYDKTYFLSLIKKISHRLAYYTICVLFRCFSITPDWFAKAIAYISGWLWYLIDRRHRHLTLSNLTASLGRIKSKKRLRNIAVLVFINTIYMIFEMAKAYRWSPEKARKMIRMRGLYHLKIAHGKGKGVLLLSGHTGNWEMSVHLKTLTGIDGCGVYRKLDFPPLERFVLEKRKTSGCRMYALKESTFGILNELNKGNFVGLLIDQNAKRRQGVFIEFFGRPACANKGLAQLAMSTKAPVIPYFFRRENNRFILAFGPEIPWIETGDKEKNISVNTQNYNKIVEDFVRQYPDQWLWMHNRWKNQPAAI